MGTPFDWKVTVRGHYEGDQPESFVCWMFLTGNYPTTDMVIVRLSEKHPGVIYEDHKVSVA